MRDDGPADRDAASTLDQAAARPEDRPRPRRGPAARPPRRDDSAATRALTEEVAPRRRGLVVAALMLAIGLAAIDSTIVATAIPQIVGDLGGFSKLSLALLDLPARTGVFVADLRAAVRRVRPEACAPLRRRRPFRRLRPLRPRVCSVSRFSRLSVEAPGSKVWVDLGAGSLGAPVACSSR